MSRNLFEYWNFVDAQNELHKIRIFWPKLTIYDFAITEDIDWQYYASFRWIMRKRRFKRHVLWTIEETRLTFEELSIMLTRLKACMNSRPLYPISSDPKDFNPLIPGLFNNWSITYPDVTDVKMNQLSRFQLLQAMQQHFWDYLFHQRNKWRHCIWNNCTWDKVNIRVLIKEENCHYCDGNWSKVDQFIKIHLKNNSKIIVIIIQGFIIINYNYHSLSFKFI